MSWTEAASGPLRARRIEYFKFTARLGELAEGAPREGPGRSDDLAGLRPGNHLRQVRIFTGRRLWIQPPLGGAFEATLLFVELLLFTCSFSEAFFQLVLQLNSLSGRTLLQAWRVSSPGLGVGM